MAVLFLSDLHLSPARADLAQAFRRFLAGPAQGAQAVYLLGDLFEYWAGDDELDDAQGFGARILRDIRDCADTGVPFHFMRGNRDFLAGERFAREGGLTMLDDPTAIEVHGRRVLLSHGDALCTDDASYQAFRAQVRSPAWSAAFLARPLAERKAEIEALRARSEAEKKVKSAQIMDVNPQAVEALLRAHGYPTLIHGHTHRPARHEHLVDGHACERWVLSDWHGNGSCLAGDARGFRPEVF